MTRGARQPPRPVLVDRHADDQQLVTAAQGGDRQALETLLQRHQDRIYAVCRRLTNNDADGFDAAQEAMIAIVRGLNRFDGRSKFTTWAYRVATNATLDELRKQRNRTAASLPEHHEPAAAADSDPAEGLALMDFSDALEAIPAEFRAAVVLRDVAGCDYAEIAEILQIAAGTVRSRIARGRARLAQAMRVDDGELQSGSRRPIEESSKHE